MKKSILELLREKDSKLIAVDHDTGEKITNMSKELGTTPEDIICSALTLLELSVGKEIILVDNKSNTQTTISALTTKELDKKSDE